GPRGSVPSLAPAPKKGVHLPSCSLLRRICQSCSRIVATALPPTPPLRGRASPGKSSHATAACQWALGIPGLVRTALSDRAACEASTEVSFLTARRRRPTIQGPTGGTARGCAMRNSEAFRELLALARRYGRASWLSGVTIAATVAAFLSASGVHETLWFYLTLAAAGTGVGFVVLALGHPRYRFKVLALG